MQTIIDKKSVCSDLSQFIADISAKHLMDTINQRDIRTIFTISSRYRSSETSLQQYLAKQTMYRCSEVRCIKQYVVVNYTSTIYHNEAIVFDESVFVYM